MSTELIATHLCALPAFSSDPNASRLVANIISGALSESVHDTAPQTVDPAMLSTSVLQYPMTSESPLPMDDSMVPAYNGDESLFDVPYAFEALTTSPSQTYTSFSDGTDLTYTPSGPSIDYQTPYLMYPEVAESFEMPSPTPSYTYDSYLLPGLSEPFGASEFSAVPSPAVSPYLPSPSEMPFNTNIELANQSSDYFSLDAGSTSNGWSSMDYFDSDSSSSSASSPVSTPSAYETPYVYYDSSSSASSSASSSPRVEFASTKRCRSSSSKPSHPMCPAPPAPQARMRTRHVASRVSRPPKGMQCPATVHDLWNGLNCTVPGCKYSVESRRPDLLRHIQAHFARKWVCCGIPLVEAAKHGIDVESLDSDEAYWSEETGHMMVGGCGLMFARKDAYKRHLKRRDLRGKLICMGNADGHWHRQEKSE